jgi:3-demethoxyubiquinol 3-hydroxylase
MTQIPTMLDRLIVAFDKGLRTVTGLHAGERPTPGRGAREAELDDAARRQAAALMRVNHCGEVCAQALYQGQALASNDALMKRRLHAAAREEEDHLAWTATRIRELGGRTSLLNPLWYVGSLAIGYAAGKAGDAWNLGFLKETERQVEHHLQGHLDRLSPADARTRAIVAQMKTEEAAHADMAARLGARELPFPVKRAMEAVAKVMTTLSYRI